MTNNPGFLGIVRRITGCQQAVAFGGRVYCMRSDGGHHDNWHDDIHPAEGRLVGMSINLSQRPFAGGLFQLRERATGNFLREIANTGSGDAILFRISDQLQHRVSKVEGEVPKFAFAGWFCSNVNNYFRALQNTRG